MDKIQKISSLIIIYNHQKPLELNTGIVS